MFVNQICYIKTDSYMNTKNTLSQIMILIPHENCVNHRNDN